MYDFSDSVCWQHRAHRFPEQKGHPPNALPIRWPLCQVYAELTIENTSHLWYFLPPLRTDAMGYRDVVCCGAVVHPPSAGDGKRERKSVNARSPSLPPTLPPGLSERGPTLLITLRLVRAL